MLTKDGKPRFTKLTSIMCINETRLPKPASLFPCAHVRQAMHIQHGLRLPNAAGFVHVCLSCYLQICHAYL